MVDAAAFIDPVVPIGSNKSGGAVVKKGLRSLSLWYIGYITHQVSQFATRRQPGAAPARRPGRRAPAPARGPAGARRPRWSRRPARPAPTPGGCRRPRGASPVRPGRVLHAACGDGWLVRVLADDQASTPTASTRGPGRIERAELDGTDLREEEPCSSTSGRSSRPPWAAIVLGGVVDGMAHGEREQLLGLLGDRLAPDGVLVVHSLSPAGLGRRRRTARGRPGARPPAPRRPRGPTSFRPSATRSTVHEGPSAADYLVVGRPRHVR